uniref:Repressor of RNA polymerase III transcription n=1 Tax=Arcella intermedia TaxID=1963864 RepID=A0A6B2LGU0_9EUKA
MKFLTLIALANASSILNDLDNGDTSIESRIEAYTCKRAGTDKKLYKDLETQYKAELARSPHDNTLSVSPFGPMTHKRSRETLIELISTLNAAFPDYDFSYLRGEHFVKEELFSVVSDINSRLESIPNYEEVKEKVWNAIDTEIQLQDCDIYSFRPDIDSNPFEGTVWNFNYFFFNKKKLKRIVIWTCCAKWKGEEDAVLPALPEKISVPLYPEGDFDMNEMMDYVY